MAEVMSRGGAVDSHSRERVEHPGEIIEERRKDAEGRIGTYKYLKGKMLGKGGFAKCYVGTSMRSRNQYALKIVSKSTLVKPRAEQKLRSEIRIHRTLNHDNIVRFERYFEDGLNAYLLLELCINNSMSDLMKRRKKLVEFEARYYVSQIIHSLKYLHKHSVIHRDLKLGNLFINHDMRVKVGDFGLATKLTRPDERKKTICGTPNYIAPEILEGKNGHSFEVDIWSTGVILYTLLVGKPPFEAKDVKSTYKRIVANQYSFPDHTVVSPEAKDIIRFTLQPRPEKRPTLDQMIEHPFFTGPEAYCPSSLPESCMRESPLSAAPSTKKVDGGAKHSGVAVNDENDPGAANRVDQPLLNVKVGGGAHSRPVLGERPSSASASASVTATASTRTGSGYSASASAMRRPSSAYAKPSGSGADKVITTALGVSGDRAPPAHSSLRRASSTGSGLSGGPVGPYQQAFDIYQDGGNASYNNQNNHNRVRSSSNGNKSNGSVSSFATLRQSGLTTQEDISSSTNAGQFPHSHTPRGGSSTGSNSNSIQTATTIPARKSLSSATDVTERERIHDSNGMDGDAMDVDIEVDRINTGFKQVQISRQQQQQQQQPASAWSESVAPTASTTETNGASGAAVGTPVGAGVASGRPVDGVRPLDTLETMHKMLNRSLTSNEREAATANGYMVTHAAAASKAGAESPESNKPVPATSSGAADDENSLDAPQAYAQDEEEDGQGRGHGQREQEGIDSGRVSAARSSVNTDAGDAQSIEAMLSGKAVNPLHAATGSAAATAATAGPGSCINDHQDSTSTATAKVWVVRYVDYTSKYGLGFLLNTGSAGVYFNDSTKIVLSADGSVFQYVERRRRDSASSGGSSEHLTQTHYMAAYPQELQKKVTLLRHFRNYLIDQQRAYGESDTADAAAATGGASGGLNLPTVLPENSSSGAIATIKFGVSSAYFDSRGAVEMGSSPDAGAGSGGDAMTIADGAGEGELEMPFLKKWVRTRHAILFRLSNRVVQVVFFDRSEVLLSPEARIVTYVNKTGSREEHSLEEVLHSGRSDISKRLKYTKDIIWRLINVSSSGSSSSSSSSSSNGPSNPSR